MGDVHYCWGDFGITSEAQFASPVRVPTREVTVTSDRMRPAVWKWSRALLDASYLRHYAASLRIGARRALLRFPQRFATPLTLHKPHKYWDKPFR